MLRRKSQMEVRMKVKIEIDNELQKEEVIIRCQKFDDSIRRLQELIAEHEREATCMVLRKNNTEYYIPTEDILFFETAEGSICVHTAIDIYETEYKLYELQDILPGYFVRVSKSAIANINHIYSITRNLTASSIVEFKGTHKKIYVSRHYYKPLRSRLEEKWTRKEMKREVDEV